MPRDPPGGQTVFEETRSAPQSASVCRRAATLAAELCYVNYVDNSDLPDLTKL